MGLAQAITLSKSITIVHQSLTDTPLFALRDLRRGTLTITKRSGSDNSANNSTRSRA
jgi:hypothetical protein